MIRNFIALLLALFALNAFAAVDANKASRAELESVKGIGPGLSAKIVEARKTGEFKNWGELVERVGGIGAGNAARLSQAGLTVGGTAFVGQNTKAQARAEKASKTATSEPTLKASDKAPRKPKSPEAKPS